MTYTLSTEELKKKFGNIYLNIIFQNKNIRTTCVRKVSDDSVIAYSTVEFYPRLEFTDRDFHKRIIHGELIGKTIKDSDIQHERSVSDWFSVEVSFGLGFLFKTKKSICLAREVNYHIEGLPYASIVEFYNPEFTEVEGGIEEVNKNLLINKRNWFLIKRIPRVFRPGFFGTI